MSKITWGISAMSHDAAISVWHDSELKFASHSERFSRKKNDPELSQKLINYALHWGYPSECIWYEKRLAKTLRQLRAGQGWRWQDNNAREYLKQFGITVPLTSVQHHHSHAAHTYYSSNFTDATVICIDSIGESETLTVWEAHGKKLTKRFAQHYPHSIGLWYTAMTQRIGLKPNEDEYILMGMAAYGDPQRLQAEIAKDFFRDINPRKFGVKLKHNLHRGCRWWRPDLTTEQDMFDIAAATQAVYEKILQHISSHARSLLPSNNLVLSGGSALNCVANSSIAHAWRDMWIPADPGDAGNAIGCVLAHKQDFADCASPFVGHNIKRDYPVENLLIDLSHDGIAAVANGPAEFGPRALGNRSLLADPRGSDISDRVNAIKQRQAFRPFSPVILAEHADDYFDGPMGAYMQYTARCKHPQDFPAIAHADSTSRVQTVRKQDNPGLRELLETWYEYTGCPMLLNTSLNVKGQPIVNSLKDAREFERNYGVKVW